MSINLFLQLLALVALGLAAFSVPLWPNRVAWGWLGLFIWYLVAAFGGLKL